MVMSRLTLKYTSFSCPKSMAAASAPKTPTGFEIADWWQHLGDPLLTRLD